MIPARSQNTEKQIQNNFDLKLLQSLEQIVFGENETTLTKQLNYYSVFMVNIFPYSL